MSASFLFGQGVPLGMKYQAVARDATGEVMSNQPISIKVTLLDQAYGGQVLYGETHQVSSNEFGLFDLVIGQGQHQNFRSFRDVPWSNGEVWMEIAIDERGGNHYKTIGTSQLYAVPYAFHSGTADRLAGVQNPDLTFRSDGNKGNTWKVGGNVFNVPGPHSLGTQEAVDLVFITDNVPRLTITADGDVAIDNSLSVGEDLDVGGDGTFGGNLDVSGNGAFGGDLDVDGIARFNNTTQSTTKDDGAVIVEGGVGIEKNTNIGGNAGVTGTLNVTGVATMLNTTESTSKDNGALVVEGGVGIEKNTNIGGALNTTGITTVLNTTESSTKDDGALVVEGGAGIEKNLNVGGNLGVTGTSDLNGQVNINSSLGGAQDDYAVYPLQVEGSSHGVAIKVNGTTPNRNTNWLTLFDGSGNPMGRIEGFNGIEAISGALVDAVIGSPSTASGDYNTSPGQTVNESDLPEDIATALNNDYAVGAMSLTLNFVGATITLASSFGSILDPEDIFSEAVGFVVALIDLAGYITYNELNLGAAFESGGADYAEWLEKAEAKEVVTFGEVVGVKGGLISKEFAEAEKFMVISNNPTIIGAMPETDDEDRFAKVAFMGQVPVKMIGKVERGDYVLPSGNGDGMAVAVHPEAMKARDFARVIGIAWGESDGKKLFRYVNTAVGINTNDLAHMVDQMQTVLNQMQVALERLDPDYESYMFNATGGGLAPGAGYTTAPSLNQMATGGHPNINSVEDVSAYIQEYTAMQDIDLGKFPYLEDLVANPHDQALVQATIDHYSQALERLERIMAQLND